MFDCIYSFHIGVWTSESNFKAIDKEPKFLKLFVVFKGDIQVVYYLPKKMKMGGPLDGSAPGAVAKIERSK